MAASATYQLYLKMSADLAALNQVRTAMRGFGHVYYIIINYIA